MVEKQAIEETSPISAGEGDFVAKLRAIALRSLRLMYLSAEKRFVFCVRRTDSGAAPEGVSRRYTAITLIGLAAEEEKAIRQILAGHTLHDVLDSLIDDVAAVDNLGDVALTMWAANAAGFPRREAIWKRLAEIDPAHGSRPVVETAWALDALCADSEAEMSDLRDSVARRLLESFNKASCVFPHVIGASGARSHVSCFADMVYPIHALSNYYKATGDMEALDAASMCAAKIRELQGEAGQWWWHYDRRTGDVIEGYPVYAVHQDAMAPMALFALKDAGGPDHCGAVQKGLDWLEHSPEINSSLVDYQREIIWRKVARKEPGKLSRYANALASGINPGLRTPGIGAMFPPVAVDWESRPYHMGWLLYAWPQARTAAWGV